MRYEITYGSNTVDTVTDRESAFRIAESLEDDYDVRVSAIDDDGNYTIVYARDGKMFSNL